MNLSAVLLTCATLSILTLATGQEPKYLYVQTAYGKSATVRAQSIERGAQYPSTVTLKGNVEITVPICTRPSAGGEMTCAGYIVIRADEAEVDEGTGEIRPTGHVTIGPRQPRN